MKSLKYNLLWLLIFILCVNSSLPAEGKKIGFKSKFTPLQISIYPGIDLFWGSTPVYGISLSLPLASNRSIIYGVSTGFAGGTCKQYGLQLNLVNVAFSIYGLQGGLYAFRTDYCSGMQVNMLRNKARKVNGLQCGVLNSSQSLNGLQLGIYNYCYIQPPRKKESKLKNGTTVQIGIANKSDTSWQLGLYNSSGESKLQIGLLNYNESGFLKYFPFFNFTVE